MAHGAMSVLRMACGGETLASEWRVLHSATESNVVATSKEIVDLKVKELLRMSVSI